MNILIMTPFWKRPEIVAEYVKSVERLSNTCHNISLLAILSPEDPHYDDIYNLLPWATPVIDYSNKHLGAKKNAGARYANHLAWDYLMELNSDTIVNPAIFDLYKPYMEREEKFFGLNNLWAVDYATKETIFIPNYNSGMTYGAGRMLHRSAFSPKMWTDNLDCGMDTNMKNHLEKMGVKETVVDCGDTPMIIDLKTNTTINHFLMLKNLGKTNHNAPRAEVMPYEKVHEIICS